MVKQRSLMQTAMKSLISTVRGNLPREMRHLKFRSVAIHDDSITLISRNAELDLLRDKTIDTAVLRYLWKAA